MLPFLFLFRNLLFAACEPNPCINGGTCQLDVDSPDGFICKCPPKFSGSKCESKIYPVLLINYHLSGRIMFEANVNHLSASFRNNSFCSICFNLFFSNTVNEEAEPQSTPGKNKHNQLNLFMHYLFW